MNQWGMNNMTKKLSLLSLAGLAAMSLTACGGGSSDSGSTDTVSGNTADGAFQSGATVTLYSVDASGTEAVVDTSTVSDSLGAYSESGVANLVGLHKLRVVGTFLNDAGSGDSETQDGTIDAYFFAADASTSHTVHTSILSQMVAMLIESDASTTEDASTGQYQALLNANSQILSFFGIDSSTDATVSDPTQMNVGGVGAGSSSTSTSYKSALTKLMAFTAALNDLYKNQSTYFGVSTYSMGDLLSTFLHDVKTGNPAGSSMDASSASGQSALGRFRDRVQYYAANPSAINTHSSAATNKASFLDTAVDMSSVTQIQGFSCGDASTASMRNYLGLTYGTTGGSIQNATYDASGNVGAFSGLTNASADMVQFRCPIRAFTSKDTTTDVGGGATPVGASADSWSGSFSLFVTPTTTSSQSVLATISAVNISIGDATTGAGHPAVPSSLTVSVPTSADIVVTYIDSSGTEKAESYTNASSEWNFVDATTTGTNNAPNVNVRVGQFLRMIGTKTDATLANFGTTGTYDMRLGFGVNIGFEDATTDATGLRSLLPTDATVDNTRSLFFNDLQISTAN